MRDAALKGQFPSSQSRYICRECILFKISSVSRFPGLQLVSWSTPHSRITHGAGNKESKKESTRYTGISAINYKT